jgi:hypothetical protein
VSNDRDLPDQDGLILALALHNVDVDIDKVWGLDIQPYLLTPKLLNLPRVSSTQNAAQAAEGVGIEGQGRQGAV